MTWCLVDIENFYVSAERLFDPSLHRVPTVVASNGDHCAIARSAEAKALHISMGEPLFKIKDRIKRHGIQIRSSNYELYGDLNRRFNLLLADYSPVVEIYSIDESFLEVPALAPNLGNVAYAHEIRKAILSTLGLPTRIGLGPTRTLSKVANALAKASEKIWAGVVDLHDEDLRRRLFSVWPIGEVWGIGRAMEHKLGMLGIKTTADLAALRPAVARDVGTIVLERLVLELNGIPCSDFQPAPPSTKATAVTRQFGEPVRDLESLRQAMARRAYRASEKIRSRGLLANRIITFAQSSSQAQKPISARRQAQMSPATNDPREIIRIACQMAESMYQSGIIYTKCGILLEDLIPEGCAQGDLFGENPRNHQLIGAIDAINARFGRDTLTFGSLGLGAKPFDTKRKLKSPSWTTNINEIPIAR